MQTHEEGLKNKPEPLYFSACYVSKRYREIVLSIMRVEFVDQLCEREPVITLGLETSPRVVGLAVKAILVESNKRSAKDNPWLSTILSDLSSGKIFYNRADYAPYQLSITGKQTRIGETYLDTPGFQASKAQTINDFNKYFLQFLVQATNEAIFIMASFSEWNPIQYSKQVPLSLENEELGAVFLGFSKLCI